MIKSIGKKIFDTRASRQFLSSPSINGLAIKNATIILLYHEVTDTPSPFHQAYNLNVAPKNFEKQILLLKENFNIISPQQLLKENYKKPAILITFDDGAAGYFEQAVPILDKLNCPSLIFLNMEPIQGKIFWSGLITYLCDCDKNFFKTVIEPHSPPFEQPYFLYIRPEDIKDYLETHKHESIYEKARQYYGRFATLKHLKLCRDNKLVFFGNHLYNHYNAAGCADEELKLLYFKNQEEIEKFPNATKFFSYPFGQKMSCYTQRTNEILKQCGAQMIFGATPDAYNVERGFCYRLPMDESINSLQDFRYLLSVKRIRQLFLKIK